MNPSNADRAFAGSIPQLYERYMVPLIFERYAVDLAARSASQTPSRVLEVAAGTGVVTRQLAQVLPPDTSIVATDLNQAMLDVAAQRIGPANVRFRQADAQALPFADGSFDAVLCQFGVMFFPDRIAAYREVRRVLRLREGATIVLLEGDGQEVACRLEGRALAGVERGVMRGAAGLLRQPRGGHPQDAGVAHGVEIEFLRADLQVRGLGLAVEVDREVVGREDLAEGHGCRQARHRRDVAVVDPQLLQRAVHEPPERVLAGPRDDGAHAPVLRGCDRHIGRRPPEELSEGLDLLEPDARLQGIDVDANAAHGEHVEGGGCHASAPSSSAPSRRPP